MPLMRALAIRTLLVGVLLGAYFYGWRPYGRTAAVQSVAAPLLRTVTGESSKGWTVQSHPGGRRLTLRSPSGDRSFGWTAPAGVRFLLPALGLALVAPRRLYWLLLWSGHVALGVLGLALLYVGVGTGDAWFVLYDALTQYLVDAFSLGVAAWAVVVEFDLSPRL